MFKELFTEGWWKNDNPQTVADYQKEMRAAVKPSLDDKIEYILNATIGNKKEYSTIRKMVKRYSRIDMDKTDLSFEDITVELTAKQVENIYSAIFN